MVIPMGTPVGSPSWGPHMGIPVGSPMGSPSWGPPMDLSNKVKSRTPNLETQFLFLLTGANVRYEALRARVLVKQVSAAAIANGG